MEIEIVNSLEMNAMLKIHVFQTKYYIKFVHFWSTKGFLRPENHRSVYLANFYGFSLSAFATMNFRLYATFLSF